ATGRWPGRRRCCSSSPTAPGTWPSWSGPPWPPAAASSPTAIRTRRWRTRATAAASTGTSSGPWPAWPRTACSPTSRSCSTCRWRSAWPGPAAAPPTTGWTPRSASSTNACAPATSRWRARSRVVGRWWTPRARPTTSPAEWRRRRRRAECWDGMPFPSVVGHETVKALLARALAGGRLPPALLLTGPEGGGKRTLALEVARGLLCGQGPGEPSNACRPCGRTARAIHPDLIVVIPETATGFLARETIKIEHVRDAMREIAGLPFEARARAVVIDDAHTMTEQAMNALLKSLEEPPATSHLLLVTGSPQALLPTIRSRCQTLRFGPLPTSLLESHLQARLGLDHADARLRAVLSGGSLGAALAFEAEGYRA